MKALRHLLIAIPLAIALASCASQREATIVESLAEAYQQTEQRESILFWNHEQREIGFRNIDRILPAREIEAGDNVFTLTPAPADLLEVSYELDDQTHSLADFTSMDENRGLMVVQEGRILLERYANGHGVDTRWISFSVSKSVTSMLIGAAIHDGYIGSVDEPVAHYLPRMRGTPYENATIRDVLQMASGVAWNEDYDDPQSDVALAGGANGPALVQYLARLRRESEPGTTFNYNTGETNLVGEILRSAIGNNASTYLEHKIWKPFGMAADANWLLGTEGGGELGGCCISATLRDYARLGIFAMNDGLLPDDTRVLPEGWMNQSTTPSKGYAGYGYLWWLGDDGTFAARGIFGQIIFVDPEKRLVIAMHGNAPAASGSDYIRHANSVIEALRAAIADVP